MPSLSELVDLIRALLVRLPGVKVLHAHVAENHCSIDLTLDSWESLLELVNCADGSNIRFHCYVWHSPGTPEALADPARSIAFQYQFNDSDANAARERIELLGAYLVWQHHAAGRIPTEEANELLTVFHAAHVPRFHRVD